MVILAKIVVFVLVLSILIVLKETMLFVMAWMENTKMDISNKRLWLLACAVSYIFTIIFTGTSLV
jgi:hypothetical protein